MVPIAIGIVRCICLVDIHPPFRAHRLCIHIKNNPPAGGNVRRSAAEPLAEAGNKYVAAGVMLVMPSYRHSNTPLYCGFADLNRQSSVNILLRP